MGRLLPVLFALALTAVACTDDRVALRRGPLGPAAYDVRLDVSGDSALASDPLDARLRVLQRGEGALLELSVASDDPIRAEMVRVPSGRLRLETVQGLSPSSAGEADLASLVGQLDPPLAQDPVRIGEPWSREQRITTDTLTATLTSTLRITGFRRVDGVDAVELSGAVSGELSSVGAVGSFDGTVTGETRIVWALDPGRLAASDTTLTWDIPEVGEVILESVVRPA